MIDDLIQAMQNKTSVMEASVPSQPPTTNPKTALQKFRGKPLAMALYRQQPKRRRLARQPTQAEPKKGKPRKENSVLPSRDKLGKFITPNSTARLHASEALSMDTTQTPALSEQAPAVVIKPVSLAAEKPITELTSSAQPVAPATDQVLLMEVGTALKSLLFPIPTPDELATFIWTNYIITKLSDFQSYFLCREQFFHQFYRSNLV